MLEISCRIFALTFTTDFFACFLSLTFEKASDKVVLSTEKGRSNFVTIRIHVRHIGRKRGGVDGF